MKEFLLFGVLLGQCAWPSGDILLLDESQPERIRKDFKEKVEIADQRVSEVGRQLNEGESCNLKQAKELRNVLDNLVRTAQNDHEFVTALRVRTALQDVMEDVDGWEEAEVPEGIKEDPSSGA